MGYIKTGNDFVESFMYNIRYEYTGYIDIDNLMSFVNSVMIELMQNIAQNASSDFLGSNFGKLIVYTDNTSNYNGAHLKPFQSNNMISGVRLFKLPSLFYGNGTTNIDGVDYPNMLKLLNAYSLESITGLTIPFNESIGVSNVAKTRVRMINSQIMSNVKSKIFRTPSKDRVYGVLRGEGNSASRLEVSSENNYLIAEYIRYPKPIVYHESEPEDIELNETQTETLMTSSMVKFLERIKDERFKNYINNKQ